jgi:hypothetical protein
LYYVWLIRRSDTGVVDALFSESATAPTMPTNYDHKRLIGAVKTDSSSNVIDFEHLGDEFEYSGSDVDDVSDSSITALTFETGTLSVPAQCIGHVVIMLNNPSSTHAEDLKVSLRRKDGSPNGTGDQYATGFVATQAVADKLTLKQSVWVDENSQVEYACNELSGSATIYIATAGFTMVTRSHI